MIKMDWEQCHVFLVYSLKGRGTNQFKLNPVLWQQLFRYVYVPLSHCWLLAADGQDPEVSLRFQKWFAIPFFLGLIQGHPVGFMSKAGVGFTVSGF